MHVNLFNILKQHNIKYVFSRAFVNNLNKCPKDLVDSNLNKNLLSRILYSSYLECQNNKSYPNKKLLDEKLRKNEDWYKKNQNSSGPSSICDTPPTVPENWMDEYEFYDGRKGKDFGANSLHGTSDPNALPSNVPCNGCGAHLHCVKPSLPGYIPLEIFEGRTEKELQTIACQRCHFLKTYNIALDIEVAPNAYTQTISKIQNKYALAIIIIDLLDFPASIWPNLQNLLGVKRPVFIVGNKVDLLPQDSNGYLDHIKICLRKEIIKSGFDALNIKHISLISAKTGFGIEELITQLHKIWKYNGDVYLIGCTNVGKSTLFNILLNSDLCRPEATDLIRKATVSPWPGTTLQTIKFPILRPSDIRIYQRFKRLFSEYAQRAALNKLRRDQARLRSKNLTPHLVTNVQRTFVRHEENIDAFAMGQGTQPILTLNERNKDLLESKWCYDTPGVINPEQITDLLTVEEISLFAPDYIISPRAFRFKPGMSVFLAGLARLDFIDYKGSELDWIKIFIFTSLKQPVTIIATTYADEFYKENLGTDILGVPCGTMSRLAQWPGLQSKECLIENIGHENICSDIVLSSAGWVGIGAGANTQCNFKAYTPRARGIYVREPALIPHANRLIGKKIRNSLAYNMRKPFN